MTNTVCLIGRLTSEPTFEEIGDGKKGTIIKLAVTRSFKNIDGEYESDIIPIILWGGIAESTMDYCHKGDLVGIKGRLQMKEDKIEIIAEKITFLSSKREDEE